jgi:predicted nuclease of restriction endonuclease-like (RecB) superfamily
MPRKLIQIIQKIKRLYATSCLLTAAQEKWSIRQLRQHIKRMTFHRTLSNQKPLENQITIANGETSVESILKDPYVLDFLDLPSVYQESDLESAILSDIEKFILELGVGFCFVARQKRITVDGDHFYIDLLFYNKRLKRSVIIEIKNGKFKPAYKGQMELYLRYLHKYECIDDDFPPIGIILCTEKSEQQIELLDIAASDIHVAEYLRELPPKDILERKLQESFQKYKSRILIETEAL